MLWNVGRSALLCALAGPAIGCFYAGVLSGRPLFVVGLDIGGVPVYVYALMSAGPFGLVMGAVGGFFSPWLLRTGRTTVDAVNALRGGIVDPGELERGTWRYRVRTARLVVVVAFRSETDLVVVTGWRVGRR